MPDHSITITKGDTRTPLSVRLYDDGLDNDLDSASVAFKLYVAGSTTDIAAGSVSVQPTKTFTATASTDKLSCAAHGIENGWEVKVSTSSALPAGLSSTARYFAMNVTPNTLQLTLEPNGAIVDITDAGAGTQSIEVLGHVQYAWHANDVDTAGEFLGRFIVTASTKTDTFPNNQSIAIKVVEGTDA